LKSSEGDAIQPISRAHEDVQKNHRLRNIAVWSILCSVLLVAGYLRLTGLNWDEGQWIHPDEGHMRIITSVIEMPDSLGLYFNTHESPLNPRNNGHTYSYGTLPLFLARWTGEWLDRGCEPDGPAFSAALGSLLLGADIQSCSVGTFTASRSAQVGRLLSAMSDLGTVILAFLIGRRLYGAAVGLLAAALATFAAFTIQQAHFFTVDSMANFFMVLTAYLSIRAVQPGIALMLDSRSELSGSQGHRNPSWLCFSLAGLSTGLAVACKISAVIAALFVALAAAWWWLEGLRGRSTRDAFRVGLKLLPYLFLAALLSLVAFRIAQPYAFEGPGFLGLRPSPEWFERVEQIRSEQSGDIDLPSGRQWTNRAPFVFPLTNMVVWGMGLPLGLTALVGWTVAGVELLRGKLIHLVLWAWVGIVFLYQATRWVKAMRYLLPLYPFLAILAAYVLMRLCTSQTLRFRRLGCALTGAVVAGSAIWAVAVFSIYLRPHTRVAASRWILANVPAGSTIANEHWDWGLPLRVDGTDPFGALYYGFEMEHYNEDTPEKRSQLYDWLDRADYVIMASNRLYASIPRLAARYPLTTAYYRSLFAGQLGFELVADFTSYPSIGPVQFPDQENPFPLQTASYRSQREPIEIRLPAAEEAFSVYDHPRVLIFQKTSAFSRQLVEDVLGRVDVGAAEMGLSPKQATTTPQVSGPVFAIGAIVLCLSFGTYLYHRVTQGEPYKHT
jgi:4-amino-4-deoxy-L-arabinose transferase-like glycosyltransferase